jgi:hypothetical protein
MRDSDGKNRPAALPTVAIISAADGATLAALRGDQSL